MQDNAITWKTQWKSMFTALDSLYSVGQDLIHHVLRRPARSIHQDGHEHITADNKAALDQQLANLKQQQHDGI